MLKEFFLVLGSKRAGDLCFELNSVILATSVRDANG